jgi:hypothetical protein
MAQNLGFSRSFKRFNLVVVAVSLIGHRALRFKIREIHNYGASAGIKKGQYTRMAAVIYRDSQSM